MKWIVALLFILNIGAFVWLSALPDDNKISQNALSQDTQNAGEMTLQVECGRQYQELFNKHQNANWVIRFLLLLNIVAFFTMVVVLYRAEKQK